MSHSTDEVIRGFYTRVCNERLKAKVIVDYIREPFVFAPGNVRNLPAHKRLRKGL